MILFAWTVECMEPGCNWVYSNTVKSDVDFQVRCHRSTHERMQAEARALDDGMPEWTT